MDTTIYATILTGFGVVVILLIAMLYNQMRINQQAINQRVDEVNRRIDESRQETNRRIGELRQDLLAAIDNKFKIFKSAA